MISTTKANKILNNLFGQIKIDRPSYIYLGMTATLPTAAGALNDGEPDPENIEKSKYERKVVGGENAGENCFSTAANGGKITNSAEIKFNTARVAYDKKMMYWFLSESSTRDSAAFLWGRLKDVLYEKSVRSGFAADSEISGTYSLEKDTDDLLNMASGKTYVVWWRNPTDSKDEGKEYDLISSEYVKDEVTYIHIGNPIVTGGNDDGTPFAILYKQETVGAETTGTIKVYSTVLGTSFEVGIYGLGLDVKKATVPTFYKGELEASIEVQDE